MSGQSSLTVPKEVWALSSDEVLDALQSTGSEGLSDSEVKKRKQQFGPNRLKEHKRRSLWLIGLMVLELDTKNAVTISFLTLALAQLWHVFNMRGDYSSLFGNTITQNPWVWGALALCILLLLFALYIPPIALVLEVEPPGFYGWMTVLGMSLIPLILGQFGKVFLTPDPDKPEPNRKK